MSMTMIPNFSFLRIAAFSSRLINKYVSGSHKHQFERTKNDEYCRIQRSKTKWCINQGYYLEDIEHYILPIVEILNNPALGLSTIASCHGHIAKDAIVAPYVFFHSPVQLAKKLNARMVEISRLRMPKYLNDYWVIEPVFHSSGELCFRLINMSITSSKNANRKTLCKDLARIKANFMDVIEAQSV